MRRYIAGVILWFLMLVIIGTLSAFAAQGYEKYTVTADQGQAAAELAVKYAQAGVPFKLGGQVTLEAFAEAENTDDGIDASGLVVNVYKEVLGEVRWAGGGGEEPLLFADVSSSILFNWNTVPVSLEELRAGDLIFFKNSVGKIAGVGIFLAKKGDLVHFVVPSASQGRVIETYLNIKNAYWQQRFAGAGRLTYWQK
ncbi:MAG: C40 family peptidase [Firmicutes bacterium]|nr:C40 family peptidase [Bacillota bacterium]